MVNPNIRTPPPTPSTVMCGVSNRNRQKATTLVLALGLEVSLVLFPQLLIDLGSLGGLVAVCASGQGGVLLALPVLERLDLALVLTLLLALKLVGD